MQQENNYWNKKFPWWALVDWRGQKSEKHQ